jgi:transcriptional regulator with XRE-family HTH domain
MFDGKKIKEKRSSLNWSASKLAKHLKVKAGNIYKWEQGIRPSDPEEFIKVQEWLNDSKESVKQFQNGSNYQEKYIALLEKQILILEDVIKKLSK